MDKYPGLVSKWLQNWLQKEYINIEISTRKNGIADIESVHEKKKKWQVFWKIDINLQD